MRIPPGAQARVAGTSKQRNVPLRIKASGHKLSMYQSFILFQEEGYTEPSLRDIGYFTECSIKKEIYICMYI